MKRLIVIFSLLCPAAVVWGAESTEKFSALFGLVDDFGARDLSCCGSEVDETPNRDLLAELNGWRKLMEILNEPRIREKEKDR